MHRRELFKGPFFVGKIDADCNRGLHRLQSVPPMPWPFSGTRQRISDEDELENCEVGINQMVKLAEKKVQNVCEVAEQSGVRIDGDS
jgi:hypothetical protein